MSPSLAASRSSGIASSGTILPRLAERGIHTQLVTSAVRPIPPEWAPLPRLQVVVSIDGLQPEHDERRTPATYERILKHIDGHQITVHCTVTRQQVRREGYLEEFLRTWQANANTRLIWMSLYTPQKGELSAERLTQGRPRARDCRLAAPAPGDLETTAPGRLAQRVRRPSEVSVGVHLRADDRVLLRRSRTAHHPVPVRRRSRLPQLRMYGVGRAWKLSVAID